MVLSRFWLGIFISSIIFVLIGMINSNNYSIDFVLNGKKTDPILIGEVYLDKIPVFIKDSIQKAPEKTMVINRNTKDPDTTYCFKNKTVQVYSGLLDSCIQNRKLLFQKGADFYHITYTHKITFVTPPPVNAVILITYYKGRNNVILDTYGKVIQVDKEVFTYTGSTVTFNVSNPISSVITLDINGLVEDEASGYTVGEQSVTLLGTPVVGSVITVSYLY